TYSIFISSSLHPLPSSPPFPYTTLFRSLFSPRPGLEQHACRHASAGDGRAQEPSGRLHVLRGRNRVLGTESGFDRVTREAGRKRSEEHTSELQSLAYLVCRLLLEKKKNN